MEGSSVIGAFLLFIIALLIKCDAEKRGMNGGNWAVATFSLCLFTVPIYMFMRNSRKTESTYTKKQIIAGTLIFFVGLIFLLIMLYYKLFIPYHIGEFDLFEIDIEVFVSFVFVYIFAFLALLKKDLGLLALGFYSIFLVIIVYLIMLLNHSVYDNNYSVYRDRVTITNGYLLMGDYEKENIGLYDLINSKYSNVALEGRDNLVKSKKTGLYYKGRSLSPFEGVYISLNQDESSIKKVLFFKNGVKDSTKEYINENKVEEIEYYYDKDDLKIEERKISEITEDGEVNTITKYYKNGQIKSEAIRKGTDLYGEYTEYYENGQVKNIVVPFKGKLIGEFKWVGSGYHKKRVVYLKHGKSTYYHENDQLNVEHIYEDEVHHPRVFYNKEGELAGRWEDVPLPDAKKFIGKEKNYKISKGVSYKEGKIDLIRKTLWYRYDEWEFYKSQYKQGYYFEYDDKRHEILSRQYADTGSFAEVGLWLDIRDTRIAKKFYLVNGKSMTYTGEEKNGNKIGIWRYYYPSGVLAAVERYSEEGILKRGEYIWSNEASIEVITNEKGGAKKAIVKFAEKYGKKTNPITYDLTAE